MKLTLVLLIQSLSLACFVGYSSSQPTIEEVCANSNENHSVGWTRVEEVQDLLNQWRAKESICHERYHNSLKYLQNILTVLFEINDVCGTKMYDLIRDYHTRFINSYVPEADKERVKELDKIGTEPIPSSLYDFFISFTDSISSICKKRLVEQLESSYNKELKEDFELMAHMREESSRLDDEYHEEPKKIEDVVLDVNQIEGEPKLYVQVRFNDILKRAKDVCEKRFKPVYDELFVPVIRLVNLGYWDKLESKHENLRLNWDKKFTRWYNIIQTCEILKDIEVIQDSSSLAAAQDLLLANDKKTPIKEVKKVTILTPEEAEALKAKIAENIQQGADIEQFAKVVQSINVPHAPVKFGSLLGAKSSKERRSNVERFEKRVRRYKMQKTNFLAVAMEKTNHFIKSKLSKAGQQIKNKDTDTAMGKVSAFLTRHRSYHGSTALVSALIFVL